EPPALATIVPDIPQPVERLVTRCLRKDVSRRAQHASDVKIALEELQEDSAANVSAQGTAAAAARRGRRARPVLIIAGLVIVLAITAAITMWHSGSPPAA